MEKSREILKAVKEAVGTVIVGKDETINQLLAAVIAGGHVLLEDLPGTGKTLLAKTLAKAVSLDFGRVQFTPDLMPSDVTGINYYQQKTGEFVFRKGPVFANILLADEINRATPRTQSSLLEAMEERQVTVDGESRRLPDPFFVLATQNPVESAGTFPLPEAQMDRFLMKLSVGFPKKEEEKAILQKFAKSQENPLDSLSPVCTKEDLILLKQAGEQVYLHPELLDYLVNIVQETRKQKDLGIMAGVSPRGSLAFLKAVKAYALVLGRDYVVPEDIHKLAVPVLAHRLVMPRTYMDSSSEDKVIRQVLNQVPVPTEDWREK